MRVRCDKGMRYKVILRDQAGWDTIAWCFSFDTTAGQWIDLKAPLSAFIPVVRGNTLRSAPRALDRSKIYSVQVMLSKYEYDGGLNPNFQEGRFPSTSGAFVLSRNSLILDRVYARLCQSVSTVFLLSCEAAQDCGVPDFGRG